MKGNRLERGEPAAMSPPSVLFQQITAASTGHAGLSATLSSINTVHTRSEVHQPGKQMLRLRKTSASIFSGSPEEEPLPDRVRILSGNRLRRSYRKKKLNIKFYLLSTNIMLPDWFMILPPIAHPIRSLYWEAMVL